MNEQEYRPEGDDTEGHARRDAVGDDTEGHAIRGTEEDDTEGHFKR